MRKTGQIVHHSLWPKENTSHIMDCSRGKYYVLKQELCSLARNSAPKIAIVSDDEVSKILFDGGKLQPTLPRRACEMAWALVQALQYI